MFAAKQFIEGYVAVGVTRDRSGRILVAVGKRYAANSAAGNDNLRNLGFGFDFDSEIGRRSRQRLRESAHPAAHVSPNAPLAVGLAHNVMKEDVSRARHRRRSEG